MRLVYYSLPNHLSGSVLDGYCLFTNDCGRHFNCNCWPSFFHGRIATGIDAFGRNSWIHAPEKENFITVFAN